MKNKSKKGFTLIEMLIVVAIIGLLAMIVLFAVARARRKSLASKMMSDMEIVMKGLEMGASDGCATIAMNSYFTGEDESLKCEVNGEDQVYIKRIPRKPFMCSSCGYKVEDADTEAGISTSSYVLTATGFANNDEFICSEGSCYCTNPSSEEEGNCLEVE